MDLWLHDVSPDGRALVKRGAARQLVLYRDAQGEERDVSWFDASRAMAFSSEGTKLLLADDQRQNAYLMDLAKPGAVVKLGEGVSPRAISSDGSLVLARGDPPVCQQRLLVPVRSGVPRVLARGPIKRSLKWAHFTDGDRKVVFSGMHDDAKMGQVWMQPLGGEPRAITPVGVVLSLTDASPDGKWFAASVDNQGKIVLIPTSGNGCLVPIPAHDPGEPVGWHKDGRLVVWQNQGQEYVDRFIDDVVLHLLDVRTGKQQPWRVIYPGARDGFAGFISVRVHPSGA